MLRFAAGCLVAASAFAQNSTPPVAKPAPAKPKVPAVKRAAPPKPALEPGLYATITTSMGPILIKFFESESPITVKNFVDLALGKKAWMDPKTNERKTTPLYNGLIFHRVIPGFMIQGGDPTGTGMGGTDEIPDEFHPSLHFDRPGRVAMANAGPSTGSSQFFITEVPTPHLEGRHTIFAQVIEGQDVVDKIANVPRNPADDKPNTPVRIVRVSVKRVGAGAKPAPAKAKPGAAKPKPAVIKPAVTKPGIAKPASPKPAAPKPAP